MFSHRLAWPPRENRLAALLREKRARAAPLLDLTESNPTRVGLPYPSGDLAEALADPGSAAYEPDPRGYEAARQAVAAWCGRAAGPTRMTTGPVRRASADRLVLTASTSEAYSFLFRLLCDPGDGVLVPAPSYPLFDCLAALDGVQVASYPLAVDDRFRIDLQELERLLLRPKGPTPRAVVLVSPNNPTGSVLRAGERAAVDSLCARSGAAVIADEVFLEYLHDPGPDASGADAGADAMVSAAGPLPGGGTVTAPTFTLGGLSKSCGLPQMKLGWILADGPADARQEALDRLEFIADAFLSVGTPVQRAAARLLTIGDGIASLIRGRVRENLAGLRAAVPDGSACRVLPADGGWSAVVQVPAIRSEEDLVLALLREDDVLVHPGYFFDFPKEAFLVLSLLPEPAVFREATARILARAGG